MGCLGDANAYAISFCIYHYIEMCTNDLFLPFFRNRKYFYCHPMFIRLARYDRENSTALLELLEVYLETNCSIARTSQRLYMHRNTVLNKLGKIHEITGESLDNPIFRESLLFSFRVKEYIERYCGEDLFPGAVLY